MLLPFVAALFCSSVAGSGLWHGNYGSPWTGGYAPYSSHAFDNSHGSNGGLAGGWNHLNDHNFDNAHGYAEGDNNDWSKLSYGGHKSRASGDSYNHNYAHDSGNDFGHDNRFENGFDHGHNFYGNHYAPSAWDDYRVPYHYD
ncbi:hypothetical protein M3Y97_00062700 [Aphelenchoides bicaudatus]|nr:hypothetical protein M3Y97_00062700 [Aphelenchoides bicaudatus]